MRIPTLGLAATLAASIALIASGGCALLIPPSWQPGAPLPLAGDVDTTLAEADAGTSADGTPLNPETLSDEQLLLLVEHDRNRLIELAAQEQQMSNPELREIANRLPLLLRELENRGAEPPGSRIRHPVIR